MPRGDGTGPLGPGSGGGRGRQTRFGAGGCRSVEQNSADQVVYCQCPNCGNKAPQKAWTPCSTERCQHCGTYMVRS